MSCVRGIGRYLALLGELATRARTTTRIGKTEATFTRLVKATPIVENALKLVQQLPVTV